MPTIYETSYRSGQGAGDLLDYIQREGSPLKDRTGQDMSAEQRERFEEKSEKHQFERDIIISPENGEDLSREDMGRATRQHMSEFTEDRPTVDYCYAVHDDTENQHVHVAATGEKDDLYMDSEDIMEQREHAHDRFQDRERSNERSNDQTKANTVGFENDLRDQDRETGIHR